jgi:molybdopterin-guanine dinucleotide biosynthesis protein A
MSLMAALLMGGRSTRMGRDKTLVEITGVPLWLLQWQKLRALAPAQLLLSARPDQDVPVPPPPAQIVRDAFGDIGPLGGVLSCLEFLELAAPGTMLLVLATDLPRVPVSFLQDLAFHAEPGCGAVVRHSGRFEPLAAVYPAEMLEVGRRRVRLGWLALQGFVEEGIERNLMQEMPAREWPEAIFANLNTPADLAGLIP